MTDSIGKQEKIIAEVQDLYQPFIQVRTKKCYFDNLNRCRNAVVKAAAERRP